MTISVEGHQCEHSNEGVLLSSDAYQMSHLCVFSLGLRLYHNPTLRETFSGLVILEHSSEGVALSSPVLSSRDQHYLVIVAPRARETNLFLSLCPVLHPLSTMSQTSRSESLSFLLSSRPQSSKAEYVKILHMKVHLVSFLQHFYTCTFSILRKLQQQIKTN